MKNYLNLNNLIPLAYLEINEDLLQQLHNALLVKVVFYHLGND
jgi:hypothetical protein